MFRALPFLMIALLAGCKPPASDDYVARTQIADQPDQPSTPIVAPDTVGAIWAPGREGDRLIFGLPGQRPLMALECRTVGDRSEVTYIRYALADPHAQAMLALVGNGHVSRLKIDAQRVKSAWLWQGAVDAHAPELDVFTGPREVEATVPGAGSLKLNPSDLPGALIDRCRGLSASPAEPVQEDQPTAAE